jgi:hypothetical protein
LDSATVPAAPSIIRWVLFDEAAYQAWNEALGRLPT